MEKIIKKLILIFEEIIKLLEENNGQYWANEMKVILVILNDETLPLKERFYEVKSTFKRGY